MDKKPTIHELEAILDAGELSLLHLAEQPIRIQPDGSIVRVNNERIAELEAEMKQLKEQLVTARDVLESLPHYEGCDTNDHVIPGKPCNCPRSKALKKLNE